MVMKRIYIDQAWSAIWKADHLIHREVAGRCIDSVHYLYFSRYGSEEHAISVPSCKHVFCQAGEQIVTSYVVLTSHNKMS